MRIINAISKHARLLAGSNTLRKCDNAKYVIPDNTPLHIKRGWIRRNNDYRGYYRTQYGAWKGRIVRRGDKFNVFISNPPIKKLEKHSRWPCFHQDKGKTWRIVLAVNPNDGDVGSIIFYIEKIIIDSYRAY